MSSPKVIVNSTPVVKVTYGLPAAGVPKGGDKPQVLKKSSSTNYDTEWGDVEVLLLDRTDLTFTGTLSKGDPVYINSSGQIAACDASDSATLPPVGLVAGNVSASGDDVDVVLLGALIDANTAGFSVGDRLYVDVSGGLTDTAPSGLNGSFSVGVVSKSDATNGIISVNIDGSDATFEGLAQDKIWVGNASGVATQYTHELSRLTDVDGSLAPTDNQVLVYNFATSQWEANTLSFDDIPLAQLPEGHVYVGNSSNETTTTDTIYVDVANSRVGIGTTSPQEALHVSGRINVEDDAFGTVLIGRYLPSTTGSSVTALGTSALQFTTSASNTVAVGSSAAGYQNGDRNTAVGHWAMRGLSGSSGDFNVAVGPQSLLNLTSGDRNVAVGPYALNANTISNNNVAVGDKAGYSNTTASGSTYIGTYSGQNAIGYGNVGVGMQAARGGSGATFTETVAVGFYALNGLTTGTNNTAVGFQALGSLTTGSQNTVLGYQAGSALTVENDNTLIGHNTVIVGSDSTVVGQSAQSGATSVSVGSDSVSADNSVAVGYNADSANLAVAIGGDSRAERESVSVGRLSGFYNQGEENTAIGYGSGAGSTSGANYDYNTLIGYMTGFQLTTGSGNVLLGHQAGYNLVSENHQLHITGHANLANEPLVYGEFDNEFVKINGDLEVRDEIVSSGGADIVLNPDGLGNVVMGNYEFDVDQTVDATTNNYVLTYDDGTGEISLRENIATIEGATEVSLEIRNDTGGFIAAGTPIYSIGEIGGSNRIRVGPADASDPAKMPAIGIAKTDLQPNDDGEGVILGTFNTNMAGYTGLAVNDILYVAAGGGLPTQTKPTGTNLIQNVGIVLKTNGTQCQGFQVSCIGRSNAVPNIPQDNIWLGDASGVATPTTFAISLDNAPALGGDLDVNGNMITSSSNGDVVIDPDGTGAFIVRSNEIRFEGEEGGLSVGGIRLFDNDLLAPDYYVELKAPIILTQNFSYTLPSSYPSSNDVFLTSNSAGTMSWSSALDGENDTLTGITSIKDAGATRGRILFYDDAEDNYVGLKAPDVLTTDSLYNLPTDYPSISGYVLSSDTSGNMSWVAGAGLAEVVDDLTPQLGGNLDVNGKKIVSAGNVDVEIDPSGTGEVIIRSSTTNLIGSGPTTVPTLKFFDFGATNFVGLKPPASLTSDSTYTLPEDYPSVSGYALTSTTAGVMSWQPALSASVNIGNTDLSLDSNRTLDITTSGSYDFEIVRGAQSIFKVYGNGAQVDVDAVTINLDGNTNVKNTLTLSNGVSSIGGEIRIKEATDNGGFYTGFQAPDLLTSNSIYTIPDYYPSTSGQVLSSTDAGVMSWVDQPSTGAGISGTPVDGQLAVWTGSTDIEGDADLTFTTVSGRKTLTVEGEVDAGRIRIEKGAATSAGGNGAVGTGAEVMYGMGNQTTVTAGNVYYLTPGAVGSGWIAADAGGTEADVSGFLGVSTTTDTDDGMLIRGIVKINASVSAATTGDPVYLNPSTPGGITLTRPTTAGEFVRIVGYVVYPSNNLIYFDPDKTWIEL